MCLCDLFNSSTLFTSLYKLGFIYFSRSDTSLWKDVINANLPKPAEIFCYPNKDLLEREHIKRAPKIKPKVTIEK